MQDGTNLNVEESVHAMLMSSAPEDIQSLVEFAEDMNNFGFSVAELDEIADGKNTAVNLKKVKEAVCLLELLPSIDWWVGLSICPSSGRRARGIDGDPALRELWERLLPLLNDVLANYAPALASMRIYSGHGDDGAAHIELLRRYRIYTRAVCDFARYAWPNVNLDWLYQRP